MLAPGAGRSDAHALDARAERLQFGVDVLVAAVDLVDASNDRATLGGERRDHERDAGSDVRAGDAGWLAAQARRPVDQRAVGITQHDARAHADELVDEEQPAL